MPTYTYRCNACGQTFQRFQRMSDAPVAVCPDCGGAVERLIEGGGGFIMKGGGHGGIAHALKALKSLPAGIA
ncbi:MAG TPA: zinc ribbon domain-containing protein, partial [Desulfobacteraceae bacterium]|nr:zinc ribbon domain-containing protein [Desulfobacteraceae bacterium]